MKFEELWRQVEMQNILPEAAILHVLDSLSESTKNELQKRSPADVANIIADVVKDINNGSVKTINELVWKKSEDFIDGFLFNLNQ